MVARCIKDTGEKSSYPSFVTLKTRCRWWSTMALLGTFIMPSTPGLRARFIGGITEFHHRSTKLSRMRWTRCFRKVSSSRCRVHGPLPLSWLRRRMNLCAVAWTTAPPKQTHKVRVASVPSIGGDPDSLRGAPYFFSLDHRSGCWQIPTANEGRKVEV